MQRLLDIREVAEQLATSPATIKRMADDGTFPLPIRVGKRLMRWPIGVVDAWLVQKQQRGEVTQ